MDDTQLLDCTQAIPCDLDDDEEEEEAHHLVAWLEVNGNRHEIFSGRNIIGRDPDKCKVFIPSKVLSKEHAVVEVRAGTHTLADLDSSNKTRLGKMTLRPHVQYALQGGEKIRFGNVAAIYTIKPEMCDDDSGSETCSESLLPMMGEEEEEERSSSPIFAPRLDYQVPQDAQQGAVENGIEVPPASAKSSHTPQSEGAPPSASPGTSLLQTSVSFLQPSDAESSVISATQSPSRRNFTSLSPNCTPKSLQEDYDSDRSTDVEDNTTHEPSLPAPQCETPTDSASCTFIPETPAQPSFDSLISKTPEYYSTPNRSIQETSTGPSPLSLKRENISLPPSQITSISETPSNSSLADTVVKTLGMTQKDDMSTKSHNDEDVFKKPLTTFTPKTCRTPTDHFSPKSSLVSKAKEAVPVHLFSTKDSHPVDPDAPRQVSTRDVPSDDDHDALTQVFTGEVDLDAPTQVFTHDTSVDLDAPTQVFTNDVDLDAPTQVFTHDTGVDLDAPTQVFTSGVDFNAHKQVCTSDIDLDAPTQVFTSEAPSNVDLDAPTQLFTNDIPSDADPDAPTQVFTSDAASNVDPDAPTQVFTSDAASNVDPDAPTQVFTSDAASNVDPDVPTQVFTSEPASNVDPDVPTQVFTSEPASNVDPDVPTQVFTSEPASNVDPDVPTQVFTSEPASNVDPDVPTQVFTSEPASNVDPDAPTQVFTSEPASNVDPDVPTQVFTSEPASNVDPDVPTQVLTSDAPSNVDPDAPTQVFTSEPASNVDPDVPTQVFTSEPASNVDPDVPTQVFTSEPASNVDPDVPTQVFTSDD
ncbi:uncharacterized protein LOC126984121 [Eriocheir sinensis]|uniref:uncharacterized protein LOC126984121 n=1 Tax=Eriocheir sinensis TaxID=95602 RepID=UPI0021C84577|nr:uncharacterized protein LOC126984121 [Eriocheir sinensis]